MNSVFSEPLLAEKLSKVNSTQQCIETLSHWCIFHRSKAEVVVATWEKQFHSLKMVQKVALLYLANDILQNSKRNGNEFVAEFWKVLPGALKNVLSEGEERGKSVVSRLVDIWEERRVFGSRGRSLKELMLGEELPPPLEFNGSKKRPRSIKIMKRDSRSIRMKLSVGGLAEKIVSAFHLVLSEQLNEESEMSKCNSAVNHIRKLEKDVDVACSIANNPKRKSIAKELEEEEKVLKQCVEKLKLVEANRLKLISQLKEALQEQESELENVRTQMQVAGAQAEESSNWRKQLENKDYISSKPLSSSSSVQVGPTAPAKSAAAIAAEVADRLTASTSSQLIMTSVLSTFAAQEAKTAGLDSDKQPPPPPVLAPVPDANSGNVFNPPLSYQPPPPVLVPQTQNSQVQYHMALPNQQYMGYSYSSSSMAPQPQPQPPQPPPHMVSPMVPMTQQMLPPPPPPPSFRPLQPPGMVYYAHLHHSQ